MKKVFASVEVSETVLVRDALLHNGIEAIIPNEHATQTAVPAHRPPAEVWIRDHGAFERAMGIVRDTVAAIDARTDEPPWTCPSCREHNPQSFDVCWNCDRHRP